jgi:putative membrane protein
MTEDIINLVFLFLGIFLGLFTGLLPGIHPNTIVPLSFLLLPYLNAQNYIYFLLGMVVTHYFINYIPSAFIGVPDSESAVSVLPLHNLTLDGRGYEGVILAGVGAFSGIVFSLVMVIILLNLGLDLKIFYETLKPFIPYFLIFSLVLIILFSKNKFWSSVIMLLSGVLGIETLYLHQSFNPTLTALFTGMFGIPLLIENLKTRKINHQIITFPELKPSFFKSSIFGTLGGFIRIFLPAIGGAQLNFFLSKIIMEEDLENFIVSQGSITLSNEFFSILALILIGNGRSGIAEAIGSLNTDLSLVKISFYMLIASAGALGMMVILSRYLLRKITDYDYRKISLYLIAFCTLLVFILSYNTYPIYHMVIYVVSVCIGILCIKNNVNLSYMMCVLIFPTILYFML